MALGLVVVWRREGWCKPTGLSLGAWCLGPGAREGWLWMSGLGMLAPFIVRVKTGNRLGREGELGLGAAALETLRHPR